MIPGAKFTVTEIDVRAKSSLGYLRSVSLFSNLSDKEIARFHNTAQIRSYKKNKIIHLQGEAAEFFYIIRSGWIKLFHIMPEGEEVIIDMLTIDEMFGESALFDHGCYIYSAQVVEDVQLINIPLSLLKEQISISTTLAFNMLSSMSRHHRRHYGAMALNVIQNAPQRIGCFLLNLCPRDSKKNVVVQLPYNKTLIAYTLGMKSATFSRALNILRQKADIHIDGTRVEIDSVERLVKFVYGSEVDLSRLEER